MVFNRYPCKGRVGSVYKGDLVMKHMRRLGSLLLVLAIVLISISGFSGSVQADKPLSEFELLVEGADSIVIGQVERQVSRWNDEHTRIYSSVTLQIEKKLKGKIKDSTVTLVVPGGEVEGITQVVTGTPWFIPGERLAVLLSGQKDGTFEIYGLNKGKYTLGKGELADGATTLDDLKTMVAGKAQATAAGLTIENSSDYASAAAALTSSPVITSVSPSSASAGTDSPVTISGSGFGSTAGTVYFFYCNGEASIAGNIVSWSNNNIVVKVPIGTVGGYAASASSGWLYVRTSSGIDSSKYPFAVTFSYGGVKWAGASPVVKYYVNPYSSDPAGSIAAVRAAASTWSNVSGSGFSFSYEGTTSTTAYGYNSRNEIMWVNMGSGGVIGQAIYWYSGGNIVEADIEFNKYYSWSTSGSGMDIESITLHELGHWLNLRDLYGNLAGYPGDTSKVMYGFGSTGSLKRTLSSEDRQGIQWIYTGSASASIILNTPNGGEKWQAGLKKTISWSYSGSPGSFVSLQLYKAGSLIQTIISSTSVGSGGSGSYSWNIPTTLVNGSDYKIKVASSSNSSCYDYSNNNFSISGGTDPPSMTVTSPNGGETWQKGSTRNITWSFTGDPGSNVKIQLYRRGSLNSTIASSVSTGSSGQGSYAWTIPGSLVEEQTYTVKISSLENSSISDASNSYFTIATSELPGLKLTSPNGGETWLSGTTHRLEWNYSGNPGSYVTLQLFNKGNYSRSVVSSTPVGYGERGSYDWTIPTTIEPGSNYTIKIVSTAYPDCYDSSNGYFTINGAALPVINVVSPNGDETWQAGTSGTITWTYTGNPGSYLKIQLYQGGSLKSTLASKASIGSNGQGSYVWTVPSTITPGGSYTIKLTSTANAVYCDYSDAFFSIIPAPLPEITVISPDAGEALQTGTSAGISWTYTGNPGSYVKIQLYQGSSLKSTLASKVKTGTGGQGYYEWRISSKTTPGSNYSIRVTSTSNNACYGCSNGGFSILGPPLPTITVASPGGGETWQAGKTWNISWRYTENPGTYVRIQLYRGQKLYCTVVSNKSKGIDGEGSYSWTVPETVPAGNDYSIKIYSTSKSAYYDQSPQFTILAAELPTITVTAPLSGDTWKMGKPQTIAWRYSGNPGTTVRIQLYRNGSLNRTIVSRTSIGNNGQGSYNWTVPTNLSAGSQYSVKVYSISKTSYSGLSDGYFVLAEPEKPTLTLTSPEGGETWQAGAVHNITWSYTENPGSVVRIELQRKGMLYRTIVSGTPIGSNGSGSYSWKVPVLPSGSEYTIKIRSTSNSNYYDVSRDYLTISTG